VISLFYDNPEYNHFGDLRYSLKTADYPEVLLAIDECNYRHSFLLAHLVAGANLTNRDAFHGHSQQPCMNSVT
jgi:hypothetical protein